MLKKTTKIETKILALLGLLISTITLGFLMLGDIYHGSKISLPISIELISDNSQFSKEVSVDRISRGGGQFTIHKNSNDTWSSTDWASGLIISIPNNNLTDLANINLTLGGHRYSVNQENISTFSNISSENITIITLSPTFFTQRNISHIPFFKSIINWPGDFNVILKTLTDNLPLAAGTGIMIYFILLAYISVIKKTSTIKNDDLENKAFINLQIILVIILTLVSIYLFIAHNPSAYDWPAIDMGPFFERQADPSFLPQDFFTNSSSLTNPRFIFGYLIISISNLFGITWYQTFFMIKSLLTVLMPGVIFLTLISFIKKGPDHQKRALSVLGIFLFTLLIQNEIFRSYFTIALWSPYHISSNAQDIAVLFGFVAILTSQHNFKKISLFLWFITSLLHPAIGFCLLLFYGILVYKKYSLRTYLVFITAGIIIPFSALALLFKTEHPLNSADFVYQYITSNHSFHYLPSYFTSTELSPLPWYINFLAINTLFLLSYFFGVKKRDNFLKNISLLGLITYAGSIVISYIFIEKYPIKLIAIIGPSRYSMMGYWIVAICYSRIFSYVPYKYLPILNVTTWFPTFKTKYLALLTGLTISLMTSFIYTHYKDNPALHWQQSHAPLVTWINKNTSENDVFSTNIQDLSVNLPLVMRRSVFSGNGFPFREDDFTLYNKRSWLMYGSPEDWKELPGSWDGMWRTNFYHTRTPKDFLAISQEFSLQYVIIEKNFNQEFLSFKPVYSDEKISIYSVTDFK